MTFFPSVPSNRVENLLAAIMLFHQNNPEIVVDDKAVRRPLYRQLSHLPALRIPMNELFSTAKPQNLDAFLIHATGEQLAQEKACSHCANGRRRPFGLACVVSRDPVVASRTQGSCANCWYGRNGCHCTLRARLDGSSQDGDADVMESVEIANVEAAAPQSVVQKLPQPVVPQPSPAIQKPPPVVQKPSQELASTAALLQKLGYENAQLARPDWHNGLHFNSLPNPEIALAPSVVPAPAGAWASSPVGQETADWQGQYSKMDVTDLLKTQRDLLKQQQDLATKLLAINKELYFRQTGD